METTSVLSEIKAGPSEPLLSSNLKQHQSTYLCMLYARMVARVTVRFFFHERMPENCNRVSNEAVFFVRVLPVWHYRNHTPSIVLSTLSIDILNEDYVLNSAKNTPQYLPICCQKKIYWIL